MPPTLFDVQPPAIYPEAPGWKEPTTSREAAEAVDAKACRALVRQALREYGDMSADECASRIQLSILSVRPRFSELRATQEIFDTGKRRVNASGKKAKVWRLRSE